MPISKQNIDLGFKSFYSRLPLTSFKNINNEIIENIKQNSKKLNDFFNFNNGLFKMDKYLKIMNRIKTCPKNFNIPNDDWAQIYLLFMFSIDPKFEIAKIYGSCNTIKEIKFEIERKFGIFDKNIIKLEKFFIKHFFSKSDKEKIDEEIFQRAFK